MQVLAVPEPEATDIGAVARAAALPQSAAQLGIQAGRLGQPLGHGQGFQPLGAAEAPHVGGLQQIAIQQPAAELLQGGWPLLAPALQVIPGAQVVVGEIGAAVHAIGIPEPARHHGIGKQLIRLALAGLLHDLLQQPVGNDVEPVVVDGAVHQ